MQIGEIAKRTGFSPDTLRWYEKIGLIQLNKRSRGENNYRVYDAATLDRLLRIKQIKALGFTLKEVSALLLLDEIDELNCHSVSNIMGTKLAEIDRQIAELQALKARLIGAKSSCTGNCSEVLPPSSNS